MHTDEAVHAVKFGTLLEQGDYVYDHQEYHGPTLNYFTLLPAWLIGQKTIEKIDEFTLRIVPVIFGILVCVAFLLLAGALGRITVVACLFFTAVSPAMVFYSRYYIQEMLLVFFTFSLIVSGYFLFRTSKLRWAATTGVFLGLMHATKETWIIAVAAIVLAAGGIIWSERDKLQFPPRFTLLKITGILFVCFTLTSILFYSSFGANPAGIWQSVYAYLTYFDRATNNAIHLHPWHYYLKILTFFKAGDGPVWSEFAVLFFSIVGIVYAFSRYELDQSKRLLQRFFSLYSIIMVIVYSLIPYKTPWNLLSFYHGFIILAGIGVCSLWNRYRSGFKRGMLIGVCAIGGTHLLWQTTLMSGEYEAHPANPYVYGHTHPDIFEIVQQIENCAAAQPGKKAFYMQVMCSAGDYWPLPWYLRNYSHIGWWDRLPEHIPNAPLVIFSPDLESNFVHKIYDLAPPGERYLYIRLFDEPMYLRPGIEVRCYVRKKEWDILHRSTD